MLTSLSIIFLVGLSMAAICEKFCLPRIIGMLFTGIVLGPYVLNLLDPTILNISSELRQIALIIILIKAGLSLDLSDLRKVGKPAVLMSFLPASFEILTYVFFAPILLKVTYIEAAIMGAVLSAVSPAVVIPKMIQLMDQKYGTSKSIPQLIMAAASCDDIFVIVLFSTFLDMTKGGDINIKSFYNIPLSIIIGIIIGAIVGYGLSVFFETAYANKHFIRNSMKTIIVLATAFLLISIESWIRPYLPMSGIIALVSMASMIKIKGNNFVSMRLSEKFGKLWVAAEVILFVLVGASVNINYTLNAGFTSIGIIFIALIFRAFGVMVCLIKTQLTNKERLFCVIAYLPKATVQAAIGSIPLSMGLSCGQIVLSVSVLGIIITAPLGALGIDLTYKKLLSLENQ